MKNWLIPRAFWIAFVLMAFAQFSKVLKTGGEISEVLFAFITCIFGGVFWGTIGTYIYRRFYTKL